MAGKRKGKQSAESRAGKANMEEMQASPASERVSRAYKIGGISVEFPFKPYASQLAYMGKVVATLERAQRQGHCHALLESPTGSGKSLSLLCASLAWQHHFKARMASSPPVQQSTPNLPRVPSASPVRTDAEDALAVGGGFIPENTQPGAADLLETATGTSNREEKKPKIPTIFYATRTHSQISQVIREYRKTTYRVPMAVLASRKHYCTNKRVCAKENIDEECKLLMKDSNQSCPQFKNVHKIKSHSSLRKGGSHEVHDIEDLVKVGHIVKGCSYFAARSMAMDAQLVFCPYSYILNPIIRRAMEVDVKGAIVILDEAHNIEEMSREAGSLDVEEKVLDALQMELGQLSLIESKATIYQPLFDMVQGIIHWIGQRSSSLEKQEFEHYCTCWTGDKALRELQAAGISQYCFPILQECALKAIKAASDTESEEIHLTGLSASTLEGLFSSLSYLFSGNGRQAFEYQLGLQRYVKRDDGMAVQGWTHCFSLWCLNPAIIFKEIADASLSVILTSGTLSPMNSFASELGVPFEICLEAPHVINMDSQVWVATVAAGPGDVPLNASYRTADGYLFQDALGAALEEICKVVPDGALFFFPSYKLMEKLCNRWKATGQWSRLNAQKPLFVEPRGNQDNFEPVLSGYYGAIRGVKKGAVRKLNGGKKRVFKSGSSEECPQHNSRGGAAFLAVCRGKVSEGIDFADDKARAVVVVGIPFPNKKNIQVTLKKRYNDEYKSSKNLLSGDQWYCHQAFRALNQAVGRCIRHRLDFGAIILLDERFKKVSNLEYMSKWLRNSIQQFDNIEQSLEGLSSFFSKFQDSKLEIVADAKTPVGKKCGAVDSEIISCKENKSASKLNVLSKGVTKKMTKKMNDHFSCKLFDQDCMTQTISNSQNSTLKNGFTGSSERVPNKENTFASTLNMDPEMEVQEKGGVPATAHECISLEPNIDSYSESFERSPLEALNGIGMKGHSMLIDHPSTELISSGFSLLSRNETMQLCSNQNLSDIETPRSSIVGKSSVVDSCKLSCGSPYLASYPRALVCGDRMTPLNQTHNKVLEDDYLSNQDSAASVCTSGNSNRRKWSPVRFQFDDEMRTEQFGSPGETTNSHKKCQVECIIPPKDKSVTSEMFEDTCMGERIPASGSTSLSNLFEGLNCDASRPEVAVQDQNMKLSTFEMQMDNIKPSAWSPGGGNVEGTQVARVDAIDENCILSCACCGYSFGLPEKQFLVRCMITSLSKTIFVALLENRSYEGCCTEDSLQDTSHKTSVIISDIMYLNPLLMRRPASSSFSLIGRIAQAGQNSIWVEEDGCVFKALFCPQCEAPNSCVGVHVVATDISNTSLLNKVIFLVNHVKVVKLKQSGQCEVHELGTETDLGNFCGSPSIENYSYNLGSKRSRAVAATGTKLRLPKKQQFTEKI